MNINKYDKVVVNDPRFPSDTLIGTVINTYAVTPDNVAIVHLEATGETVKVPFSNLRKYEPQEKQESKIEIPEGARVITAEEFTTAVYAVTTPEAIPGGINKENPLSSILGAMTGNIVGLSIAENLFKESNDVTLNKDQLTMIVWNGCNPEGVSSSVNGDMSVDKSLSVSIASIMTLRKLVGYFFPESLGNA